jgi:signal transduction histidine kinase
MSAGPTDSQTDPRWPKLLSLTAHEFRSPLTVVAGYIRMLLKDRAGPLSDQQRRLLEEAEKSCGRLSGLLAEVSELSHLESRTAPFNRSAVDLGALLMEAIAGLPELPDRQVSVDLSIAQPVSSDADAVRLRTALTSVLHALRRELVTSDQLVVHVESFADPDVPASIRITIAEPGRIDSLRAAPSTELATFDEWRGGNGLRLANARRIIEAHGGRIQAPADDLKASAVVTLPSAVKS